MIHTKLTISALVVLALAGSTALANNKWTGNGGDILWNNPANWQKGIPDPAIDNKCQIDGPDVEVLIDATHVGDEEAINEQVRVSYTADSGAVTLTVDGGTLRCTDRLFLAAREGTTGTIMDNVGPRRRWRDRPKRRPRGLLQGPGRVRHQHRQRHPHPQRRVVQGPGISGQQQGPHRAKRGRP